MAKKILLSIYKPPKQNNNFFLHWLSERFDFYLKSYENIWIFSDFNVQPSRRHFVFEKKANLENVIKNLICFKSSNDLKTQNWKNFMSSFMDRARLP